MPRLAPCPNCLCAQPQHQFRPSSIAKHIGIAIRFRQGITSECGRTRDMGPGHELAQCEIGAFAILVFVETCQTDPAASCPPITNTPPAELSPRRSHRRLKMRLGPAQNIPPGRARMSLRGQAGDKIIVEIWPIPCSFTHIGHPGSVLQTPKTRFSILVFLIERLRRSTKSSLAPTRRSSAKRRVGWS